MPEQRGRALLQVIIFKSRAAQRAQSTSFISRKRICIGSSAHRRLHAREIGAAHYPIYRITFPRRASLSPPRDSDQPVIENASSGSCKITKLESEWRIDFGKEDFWNCGVVDCSTDSGPHYCLGLRFPAISGLRLGDDLRMTLQCRAQERVASLTRRLHLKTIDT